MTVAFTATRDRLVEALTRLDVSVLATGPAAGKINAESMADALIEALGQVPTTVHYHWPAACAGFATGDLWSGNLDRVNCEECLSEADEADHLEHLAEKWGM